MDIGKFINSFLDYMELRRMAKTTQETYSGCLRIYLQSFSGFHPKNISDKMIEEYLLKIPGRSNRCNHHNAIKLFYRKVMRSPFKLRYIPYPEKEDKLPSPISINEFIQIMQVCDNIKHKCIIMLGFDAGLRVSEVVNLEIANLNFDTKQIQVRGSKGHKDRYIKLSRLMENYLVEYISIYKPVKFLFNGQNNAPQYSVRSCQQLLKNYAIKAGITRNVTFHQARHGFAMALLENGTDMSKIQNQMGHNSEKTTKIYARINNKTIQSIQTPMEIIFNGNFTGNNQQFLNK